MVLQASESLTEYFRDKVGEALKNQAVPASELAEFYLVNLLTEFLHTQKLFQNSTEGSRGRPVLAEILNHSLAADQVRRFVLLKYLGDVALYVAGFFAASLAHRPVAAPYYIHMGEAAYQSLATISARVRSGATLAPLYSELGQRFSQFVSILAEVKSTTAIHTPQDLLSLYEHWLQTGSQQALAQLKSAGVIPLNNLLQKYFH